MTKYQCLSCLGTYESPQIDSGTKLSYEYYHTCPSTVKRPRDERLVFAKNRDGSPLMILSRLAEGEKHYTQVILGVKAEGKGRKVIA